MGWILAAGYAGSCRFYGVAMMRGPWWCVWGLRGAAVLFAIAVLLMLLPRAEASAIPLTLPANVAASGTSYVTKASAAFSGAAFNSGLTTQVAGKAVTVPAAWRLASNAGQVASAAIRVNPTWATAALLTWLVSYGLEKCADGSWCKRQTQGDVGGTFRWSGGGYDPQYMTTSKQGMYEMAVRLYSPGFQFSLDNIVCGGTGTSAYCNVKATNHATFFVSFVYYGPASEELKPAVETDWGAITTANTPDWVYSWLANKGIGLPLNPQVDPATQVVSLSDPYVDPVTGKRYKDVAYVTPSPSSPTKTADLQVAKQEVDAEGNPIVDPTTGGVKAPEETDDPCLAHPDRIGCMDKGEIPDGPELGESEKTVTITPDSGWGPDTMACPSDIVNTLRSGGGVVAYSFKAQCDFADGVRAPVIAIAWVVAVLIALGVGSKGGGD
ncbi:virulence factor TspB C-terminal domain-related protein [Cupriavidus nantongensis]